jgi:hypothetical protein
LDVAVVKKETTGQIVRSKGTGLADEADVMCDRLDGLLTIENFWLVNRQFGLGLGPFLATEFDVDTVATLYPHLDVVVQFDASNGVRKAKYFYRGKTKRQVEPYTMYVRNGRKILKLTNGVEVDLTDVSAKVALAQWL